MDSPPEASVGTNPVRAGGQSPPVPAATTRTGEDAAQRTRRGDEGAASI